MKRYALYVIPFAAAAVLCIVGYFGIGTAQEVFSEPQNTENRPARTAGADNVPAAARQRYAADLYVRTKSLKDPFYASVQTVHTEPAATGISDTKFIAEQTEKADTSCETPHLLGIISLDGKYMAIMEDSTGSSRVKTGDAFRQWTVQSIGENSAEISGPAGTAVIFLRKG